jgi:hypothetical protein
VTGKTIDDLGKEWRAKLLEDDRAKSARDRELRQKARGTDGDGKAIGPP